MNILYCGDARMQDGVLLSVLSLTRQTRQPLHVYLLTATLTVDHITYAALPQAAVAELRAVVLAHNSQGSVTVFDVTDLVNQAPPTANWHTRFTPYCMLRLYADLLSALPERVLYLDADVLAVSDPRPFYEQSLAGTELVGVLDHYGQWYFHHGPHLRDYLNSGVLLLNLPEIRRTGLFARCRKRVAEKRMFMPDQSALNKLAREKKLAPRRFNDQHGPHADTVFLHFSTRLRFWPWFHAVTIKPWQPAAAQALLGPAASQTHAVYEAYQTLRAARKG